MSKIPVNPRSPYDECNLYNGQSAAAGVLCCAANAVWSRRVKVASGVYTKTNAPTLTAATWAAVGDTTTPARVSTIKLRADVPVFLQDGAYYNGSLHTTIKAIGHLVLWNSSAEQTTIKGMRIYQGDPTDDTTNWRLETAEEFNIAAGAIVTKCITGYINPSYRDDVKIDDDDLNYVFCDADTIKAGTNPKVLFFVLYLEPMNGLPDTSTVVPWVLPRDFIQGSIGQNYIDKVMDCNREYNLTTPGTICPVDQSATSSQNYGFSLNAYRTTRMYHNFMPNTTYDSTTETRGSLWVPLRGQGVQCADGDWYYRVRLGWYTWCTSAIDVTYAPIWFPADSTTGTLLESWNSSIAASTNTFVERTIDFKSATMIEDGVAIAPRVQRTSGSDSSNVYIFSSLYSVKVLPREF